MATERSTTTYATTILWGACVAFFYASIQADASSIVVEITPTSPQTVRVGQELNIMCKIGKPVYSCRIIIPGLPTALAVRPGISCNNDIVCNADRFQQGECHVRINRIKKENNGTFSCGLITTTELEENTATMDILIAQPPRHPELTVTPPKSGANYYEKDETIQISCRAPDGVPAANISLSLDNESIGTEKSTSIDYRMNSQFVAVRNVTRILSADDNGKMLRCSASNIALERPLEAKRELTVYFAPQPQSSIHKFGYIVGQPGNVNVTVQANPNPEFTWKVDGERIPAGRADESERIQTSSAVNLGKGFWLLSLKIDSVQKSDTDKKYVLEAKNILGKFEYLIELSTLSEPAGVDLDAGTIIGIVAAVLILLLIVFLVIFARATGRWCFADGSMSRTVGEADLADPAASNSLLGFLKPKPDNTNTQRRSDTESTGRYSRSEVDSASARRRERTKITFSQLFKRNKDKVSEADTDTLRTVVTVDDEKMPVTGEPGSAANATNPAVGDAGIVYAELDLARQQTSPPPRIDNDRTEYAEIIYTKTEAEAAAAAAAKK